MQLKDSGCAVAVRLLACGMTTFVEASHKDAGMRFKRLEILEQIGSGSFKNVYRGKWGARQVAVACMQEGGILLEARLLEHIPRHPNLLTIYWWATDSGF